MGRRIPNAVLWVLLVGLGCAPVLLLAHYDPALFHAGDIARFGFAAAIVGVSIFVLLRLADNRPARRRHCEDLPNDQTPVCPTCDTGDRPNEHALYDASADNACGPLGLSRNEWFNYIVLAILSLGFVAATLFDRQSRWRTVALFFIFVIPQILWLRRHRKEQVAYQRYRRGRCMRCGCDLKGSPPHICPDCALAISQEPAATGSKSR